MKKLPLEENTWIKALEYGFLMGGVYDGRPGYKLTLTGKELLSEPMDFLQKLLKEIMSIPHGLHDVFRIVGPVNETISNMAFMRTFICALRPYGLNLQIVFHEALLQNLPLDLFSWIIYETDKPFMPYPANEVWYKPIDDVNLIEKGFSAAPGLLSQALFFLGGRIAEEEALEFFASRPEHWAILR